MSQTLRNDILRENNIMLTCMYLRRSVDVASNADLFGDCIRSSKSGLLLFGAYMFIFRLYILPQPIRFLLFPPKKKTTVGACYL